MRFTTRGLPDQADVLAPDGAEVRILAGLPAASVAEFRLQPGAVTKAVEHRSVSEIWFILAGHGRIWRADVAGEEVTTLSPGLSLTIPLGTRFQFRNDGADQLRILGITAPPWPGADEAFAVVGPWNSTLT